MHEENEGASLKQLKKNGTNITIRAIHYIYLLATLRLIGTTTASAILLVFLTNFFDYNTTAI